MKLKSLKCTTRFMIKCLGCNDTPALTSAKAHIQLDGNIQLDNSNVVMFRFFAINNGKITRLKVKRSRRKVMYY